MSYTLPSIGPKLHNFTLISLPKGTELSEDGTLIVNERIPAIALLDAYKTNLMGISHQISSDAVTSHGDLVTKYAVNGLEDRVGVLGINVISDCDGRGPKTVESPIASALRFLVERQRQHHNILAVNMSVVDGGSYDYFVQERWRLAKEDLKQNKKQAVERLGSEIADGGCAEWLVSVYRSIQSINELIELGTEVYIATGNEDDNYFNFYTLSNAHAVSSSDTDQDNEVLSTKEAPGTHCYRKKFDRFGRMVCITDGTIRFYPDEII